ncbi:hypothetical protein [Sulfuricurvum sp.]|nr:hypothetical protein [Sulfuricurvum sp.]
MAWNVEFYQGVEQDIVAMPNGIRERMVRLLEVIEVKGAKFRRAAY